MTFSMVKRGENSVLIAKNKAHPSIWDIQELIKIVNYPFTKFLMDKFYKK